MNESMVFYRSFFEAIKDLPPEDFKNSVMAILTYGMDEEVIEVDGIAKPIFTLCKPQIDANIKRRSAGRKGGEAKASKALANASNDVANCSKPVAKRSKSVANTKQTVANVNVNDNANVNVNNNIYSPTPSDDLPSVDEVKEVISYLNQKAHKDYRSSSKQNRELIRARLKDGYSVDDLKKVIDNKVDEWLGTEQEKYLRPETIFRASHIEGYLNQKNVKPKSNNQFLQFESHNYDMDELTRRSKRRSG